jgi:hypothetical protein
MTKSASEYLKNIFFRSLMITKRLLDVVSCEFKKKMFKERRSSEIFIYTGPSVLLKKLSFTGTGFKPYKAIFQATFMTKSASEYLFCKKN